MFIRFLWPYLFHNGMLKEMTELTILHLSSNICIILYTVIYIGVSVFTMFMSKYFFIKTHIINSVAFAIKFLLLIAMLIFIRGGVPRYRYDFLTKIGWIKFLSILLSLFLTILLLNYLL